MIGVDIVDHSDPRLHPRNKRALALITHLQDQFIGDQIANENLFWLFWTAKEAIFKAYRLRQNFAPKSLQATIKQSKDRYLLSHGDYSGEIHQNQTCTYAWICHTSIQSPILHSEKVSSVIDLSTYARTRIADFIQTNFPVNVLSYDSNRLPVMRSSQKTIPISISHHHNWIFFGIFQENNLISK